MTPYRLTPEAEGDLDAIKRHLIERGEIPLARRVLAEIRNEDLTNEPTKFWSVFAYLIVYDPHSKPIGIARILHGSRDLEALFRRSPPRI